MKGLKSLSLALGLGTASLALIGAAGSSVAAPAAATYPSVTQQRLLNAQSDNGWLMYRRA